MTNAMPSLQMTIKLSYGWRGLPLPPSLHRVRGRGPKGLASRRKPRPYGSNRLLAKLKYVLKSFTFIFS